MTIYAYSTFTTLAAAQVIVTDDGVMIGMNGMVIATGTNAFEAGAGNGMTFSIQGWLGAFQNGIVIGSSGQNVERNTLTVGRNGTIDAFNGIIATDASLSVTNAGMISGFIIGVRFDDAAAGYNSVTNSGTIMGGDSGIYGTGTGTATTTIVNSGTIGHAQGQIGAAIHFLGASSIELVRNTAVISGGIVLSGGADAVDNLAGGLIDGEVLLGDGTDRITNSGVITGNIDTGTSDDRVDNLGGRMDGLLLTGTGLDVVTNSGRIVGYVDLGGDDDVFETVGAGQVLGMIYGEGGNDRFIIGWAQETYDGEIGADYIDFRKAGAVTVALDGSVENTGVAEGDTYVSIEHIYGSRNGADTLIGSVAANRLFGIGGDDTLMGLAGGDLLDGGQGNDVLVGGLGNDTFVFKTAAQAGDTITDFSSAASGNNDRLGISAAGFGGGLVEGTLAATAFVSGTDNLALDAGDRFIFNQTTRTVWFDVDGTGAEGPVLVATLQAGAAFAVADIFILA